MDPLHSAAAIVKHKLSGEGYTPSLFRVGMTVTLDPTPFILAAGATRVPSPAPSGETLVSIAAVGTLHDGSVTLYRLHLPEGRGFFQLHLDPNGQPDECRFFGLIDEIEPAGADDWGFWLDPDEGMIGWPQFQAKDGTLFARAWAPGDSRMEPRRLVEQYADAKAKREITHNAMLYARRTGANPPAPPTEYLLVEAVEDAGRAWIAVHAGIDVNPAALSLA